MSFIKEGVSMNNYKNYYNERKNKLLTLISRFFIIILILSIILTIVFIKKSALWLFFFIVIDINLFTILCFIWDWLYESNIVISLKKYVDKNKNIASIIFESYINNKDNINKAFNKKNWIGNPFLDKITPNKKLL